MLYSEGLGSRAGEEDRCEPPETQKKYTRPTCIQQKREGSSAPHTHTHEHYQRHGLLKGGSFVLTVGAFLLTVKLLCLQSLKALIRRTFPL